MFISVWQPKAGLINVLSFNSLCGSTKSHCLSCARGKGNQPVSQPRTSNILLKDPNRRMGLWWGNRCVRLQLVT